MIFEELEKKIAQFLESKQADSLTNYQENSSSSPKAVYLDNYNTTTTATATTTTTQNKEGTKVTESLGTENKFDFQVTSSLQSDVNTSYMQNNLNTSTSMSNKNTIESIVYLKTSQVLVGVCRDFLLRFWDISTGETLCSCHMNDDTPAPGTLDGGRENNSELDDKNDKNEKEKLLDKKSGRLQMVKISPNEATLVGGFDDGVIRVWELVHSSLNTLRSGWFFFSAILFYNLIYLVPSFY